MITENFKGAIFDLDGTLVRSTHVWSDIDEKFLGKRGIKVPEDYFRCVSAMNFEQAAVYTNERFNLNENISDICKEWFDMAADEYAHHIEPVDGAENFLRYLKKQGKKIALATASARELYEPVLKRNGMYDYFDYFASTDMVKRGKGFPDVYLLASENLGLKPCECVVFEDILQGIEGAKAGNFTAFTCLDTPHPENRGEIKSNADYYFTDYNQLIKTKVFSR